MTISVDDYVLVPKGTVVFSNDGYAKSKATRDMVVQVRALPNPESVYHRVVSNDIRNQSWNLHRDRVAYGQWITERVDAVIDDVAPGTERVLVEWSTKSTFISLVTKTEPPAAKPVVVKKLAQFIPGSVWRFTHDCEVCYEYFKSASNPGRHVLCRISAGTVIEMVGKSKSNPYLLNQPRNQWFDTLYGTYHPFRVVSGSIDHVQHAASWWNAGPTNTVWLPYKEIEAAVEAQSVPEVSIFVLRDAATGLFLREVSAAHKYAWGASDRAGVEPLIMTASYTQAQKLKDMNHVRISIMGWNGYYEGMSMSAPDWVGSGRKVADLPATFEAVEFDKINKTERKVHDLQAWSKHLWELRGLTITYGSIVRKLYNDLEKKGVLGDYEYMLVMRSEHDYDELEYVDVSAFNEMVKKSDVPKADFRRTKDMYSMAIALKDVDDALVMQMAYGGTKPLQAINIRTMQGEVLAVKVGD
jgi:hypothetical protein